jgi:hypothetical protein
MYIQFCYTFINENKAINYCCNNGLVFLYDIRYNETAMLVNATQYIIVHSIHIYLAVHNKYYLTGSNFKVSSGKPC